MKFFGREKEIIITIIGNYSVLEIFNTLIRNGYSGNMPEDIENICGVIVVGGEFVFANRSAMAVYGRCIRCANLCTTACEDCIASLYFEPTKVQSIDL